MQDEFYIGWQDQAPPKTGRLIRRVVWITLFSTLLIGALLVLTQRGFRASHFELTRVRELKGVLETHPIPCLKVVRRNQLGGTLEVQRVLLVGVGKKSALPTLNDLQARVGQPLAGRGVALRGKLIFYDGLLALELAPAIQQPTAITATPTPKTRQSSVGPKRLFGEILDPKCYLGVMRPGEGKPHRSCAIRCLLGGIPVFFKTITPDGQSQYFFVLNEKGEPLNQQIAPYVADEVRIQGQVERWDNWWIIKTSYEKGFCQINPHWAKGRIVSMCD